MQTITNNMYIITGVDGTDYYEYGVNKGCTEKTDVNGTLWGQFMYDGYVGWCTLDGMVDCSVSGEMNPYLFYDVNLDGIVNIGDDLALKKYLLGDGESSFGDLNGDGVVNIFDRQRLRAYILGAGG